MSIAAEELKSGVYAISTSANSLFNQVGRFPAEDLSLRPKPVYNLAAGVHPTGNWIVLRHKDGSYELKAIGAPVGPYRLIGAKHENVFAFLQDEKPGKWEINLVHTTEGRKAWIIETGSGDKKVGWSAAGKEIPGIGVPIALVPLTSTKSLPPQYLPSETFIFVRLDREEDAAEAQ